MSNQDIPPRQANWAEEIEQDMASEEAFRNWGKPKPDDVVNYGRAVIEAERAGESSLVPVTHLSETAIIPVTRNEATKVS